MRELLRRTGAAELHSAVTKGAALTAPKVAELAAANEQLGFVHPENPGWDHLSFCQFAGPLERSGKVLSGSNAVAIRPGKIDRCPTGTGCSARMAMLHRKGLMQPGDLYLARSIIGSEFRCGIEKLTQVGGTPAILPTVSGRAWITGIHQHFLHPDDPWPEGYRLSDTWPGARA